MRPELFDISRWIHLATRGGTAPYPGPVEVPPLQTLLEPYLVRFESHFWIEGSLALIAALFAIALRRQTRLFKAPGFIMLAVGFIIDMMIPPTEGLSRWVHLEHGARAVALLLVIFGLIRLAVEAFLVLRYKRKADPSTIVAEIVLASLYGIVGLVVARFMLGLDPRMLLAVPALGTLVAGWLRSGNFFAGLLIQYRRPFVSGDWMRVGNYCGRVLGTGWRASWLITRNNEHVQIPNAALATQAVVNYSASGTRVADEVYLELDHEIPPHRVEKIAGTILQDVPEVLNSEVDLWEYKGLTNRYRIRFWLADYAADEKVRSAIMRNLWYALRRNSIELAPTAHTIAPSPALNGRAEAAPLHESGPALSELRRVYLLNALSDEDLMMVASAIRLRQFGRGEVLMHEGDVGDCFYILREGKVEILARGRPDAPQKHIREISDSSPENFFGEIALLTGAKRNASIRAVTDVDVWEIGHDAFSKLFRARPEAGTAIAEVAGRRTSETSQATAATISPSAQDEEAARHQAAILIAMRRIFDF